jgi:hypothetical protein
MPEDVIGGKYKGVMADHEVERFRIWDGVGDEMVVSSTLSCLVLVGLDRLGLAGTRCECLRDMIKDESRNLTKSCRNRRSGVGRLYRSWCWACLKVGKVVRRCIMMSTCRRRSRERNGTIDLSITLTIMEGLSALSWRGLGARCVDQSSLFVPAHLRHSPCFAQYAFDKGCVRELQERGDVRGPWPSDAYASPRSKAERAEYHVR